MLGAIYFQNMRPDPATREKMTDDLREKSHNVSTRQPQGGELADSVVPAISVPQYGRKQGG